MGLAWESLGNAWAAHAGLAYAGAVPIPAVLAMSEPAPPLVFDDVAIDFAGRRLMRGGMEQPLEPKAFGVLALLAGAPGRVFTRDEILDAVWGHRHVTPGVLNRVMTLLRHGLGEDAQSSRCLHTVHGVGYRFDLPGVPASPPVSEPAGEAAAIVPPVEAAIPALPGRRAGFPRRRVFLLAVLAISAIAGWRLWPHAARDRLPAVAAASVERSVAVLPLVNASGGADQQFFSDGLSESLITTLSQFAELRVVGRSSSFRFRGSGEDARTIGEKLGATHLIEGSVQRVGDDVRIGIELVRAADGRTLWSQSYDRPYKDLFALQDEIALAVAGALQIKLLHILPGAVGYGRPASGNLHAYNAFLRGTYNMGDAGDVREAIAQLAEATRLDPGYAQAWAWLGFVRTQHARFALSGEAAERAYAQARLDIDSALRLQPDNGQAHAIRANLLSTGYHDWNGALAEFGIALPLVPDTDASHGAISRLYATLGRMNSAIEERRKYIAGDPLAAFAHVYLAELYAGVGRLDDAETSLRQAMALQPENADGYASERSYLAILRGDAEAALAEAQRMSPGRRRDRDVALALQIGSDREAADAAMRNLEEIDAETKGGAYALARIHALRGDADRALDWLQRDWARHDEGVYAVLFDPLLLRFRDDPRLAAYCRTTGLPAPGESEALGLDQIRASLVAGR